MFFSFAGLGFSLPRAALDYWLERWIELSCMVCDAHLFILQFHAGSFGAGCQIEMALFFFQCIMVGVLSIG
jgi:hypothetical protein